jgi:putrescine aminotransferase
MEQLTGLVPEQPTRSTPPAVHTPAPSQRDTVLRRYSRHVNASLASLSRLLAAPVELRSAGTKVYGDDGKTYLDCGGFGVFLLGHCHPRVVAAVRRQLETHPLSTRLFLNAQLAEAAEALAAVTPPGLDHVFLTGSGAEATELGLKLARLAGKTRVVAMDGGFHGKTLGAVSVTGRAQYRDPFAPLLPDVSFVPFDDPDALATALAVDGRRTAVVLEPVQAEGGVRVPRPGYLREVRRQCTAAAPPWCWTRSRPAWAGSAPGGAPTSSRSARTSCSPGRSSGAASCRSVGSPRPRSCSPRWTPIHCCTPRPSPAARWLPPP